MEVLSWVVPLVALVAIWSFFLRKMGNAEGGLMSIGRSKAKVFSEDAVSIGFADVAGVDEAEQELREVVEFLRTPAKYRARRAPAEGRASRGTARNGQDAPGPRRGR